MAVAADVVIRASGLQNSPREPVAVAAPTALLNVAPMPMTVVLPPAIARPLSETKLYPLPSTLVSPKASAEPVVLTSVASGLVNELVPPPANATPKTVLYPVGIRFFQNPSAS